MIILRHTAAGVSLESKAWKSALNVNLLPIAVSNVNDKTGLATKRCARKICIKLTKINEFFSVFFP